ncbi:hypothetical protein J6Z48_03320 [bacterium]|nr:hypothetical protein [bacterium]
MQNYKRDDINNHLSFLLVRNLLNKALLSKARKVTESSMLTALFILHINKIILPEEYQSN